MDLKKNSCLTSHEIYSQFIDRERKYGHLHSFGDQLSSSWQHLRASTSAAAFWMYYERPMQVFYDMKGGSFCPDATKALFLICDCPYVKSYQIGDLLKLRADPNCRSFERANAPIHQLIQLRKTKAVKLLLDWGADLNCTNTAGRTPLMTACDSVECSKQLLIVNYLLQKEAINIDAWDEDGNSAATLAIRRSNIWTLRELLISGARVNVSRKRMPYFSMDDVNESEHEVALDLARSLLLNNESDRDRKSDRGNTGIQCANKIVFFLDSLRKSKREICFQMAKRKGTLERVGLNCGTDRFKTVQNIYRDELNSVRAKDTPASGRKSKLNPAHEQPLQQMEPQDDNVEGEAMEIAEDVEVTREENCFRKRKKDKKGDKTRKKKDKKKTKKGDREAGRMALVQSVDDKYRNTIDSLKSCLRTSIQDHRGVQTRNRKRDGKGNRSSSPLPSSPDAGFKKTKRVTFQDS